MSAWHLMSFTAPRRVRRLGVPDAIERDWPLTITMCFVTAGYLLFEHRTNSHLDTPRVSVLVHGGMALGSYFCGWTWIRIRPPRWKRASLWFAVAGYCTTIACATLILHRTVVPWYLTDTYYFGSIGWVSGFLGRRSLRAGTPEDPALR
jgi:hypothetical protein